MKFSNDCDRRTMLTEQRANVKYIKEHYLNQQEAIEKKMEAKLAK
jgi:hypothetical protein